MVTRRRLIFGLSAAAAAPFSIEQSGRSYGLPVLSDIAAKVWGPRFKQQRALLLAEAIRIIPDPDALLVAKEAECSRACADTTDLGSVYARISAADFRSARVIELHGVRFSEMDVAALLAA